MELDTQTTPAVGEKTIYNGSGTYAVTAGERVRLKTSGEDRLVIDCPAQKNWKVIVTIFIEETDA